MRALPFLLGILIFATACGGSDGLSDREWAKGCMEFGYDYPAQGVSDHELRAEMHFSQADAIRSGTYAEPVASECEARAKLR